MTTEKERELYFLARDRALERHTETMSLIRECREGFEAGISAAARGIGDDELARLVELKIKSETNFTFPFICGFLSRLEAIKGKHYAASWQKRGEKEGALPNVQRKVDRLDVIAGQATEAGKPLDAGETSSQTLGDAAVYSIKWLALRAEIEPTEFLAWLMEVRDL